MLPRTFLSDRYPYVKHHLGEHGFPTADYRDDRFPPQYDEALIAMSVGMWDDGQRLVAINWLNMIAWPSWCIAMTYWDRATGKPYGRSDLTFSDLGGSVTGWFRGGIYMHAVCQAPDGSLWVLHTGLPNTISRMSPATRETTYTSSTPTLKEGMRMAEQQAQLIDPSFASPYQKPVTSALPTPPEPGAVESARANLGGDAAYIAAAQQLAVPPSGVTRVSSEAQSGFVLSNTDVMTSDNGMGYISGAWLVLDPHTVLLNPYWGNGTEDIPWNGAVVVRDGVPQSYVRLPEYAVAFAYESDARVWALLQDNTVVSFDLETGDILAYFWLPIPYYTAHHQVMFAWQRDYCRLLVFGFVSVNTYDLSIPRNRYESRIVGYSTTPLPVHVCTPLPLRPVRAGRPTPFLIRQVGSLCEPIAGLAMLTPGDGVTVDRLTVPLDESGEAHVMVTAHAEGTATLTASIEVVATWDKPGVETAFGRNITWIEGT